ncbi:hypothetical protein BDW59DRAFT_27811 [Aspergillus cavernicola]|uniref:TM7S3/TM198-like domain-containing protein n=1 Tax=Aspergillus cavernicola TaxID=176166 RepID=A0ABR4HEI0_9EURO
MRVHFLVLVAYLCPVLLALVARAPHIDRQYGGLLPRETDPSTTSTEVPPDATTTNATSIATPTGNSTTISSSTSIPLLNTSPSIEEEDGGNSTAPGALPLQPSVTPALGVGGFILIVTGAVLALIGVRNLWVQVFLSSAFLTSLGVTVLIVYVMSPPVRIAIQGAYLVAVVITGLTFGALAIVFKELAEGLGCLLGGFCTSMWLLSTKPGGLITATDAKTGFIGAVSVGFYALSFSHYTRPYGLIGSTSIAGGTAIALGIDCYSKAGLKEFWLYLWALNDNIFPLDTTTYPVTRYIKVELAATVIIAIMGVISQLRLWKVVRERRAREEERREEEQKRKDEAEAEVVKRLEENNMKERMEWEAKYGDPSATESSSSSIPELATGSHSCVADQGAAKEKGDALEKESISDSIVSYRCSDCRAQGADEASEYSETQHQEGMDTTEQKKTCANQPVIDQSEPYPKSIGDAAVSDDKSSDMTAIVGTETASVYSKRLSVLSRKSAKSGGTRPVSGSPEALITRDDASTRGFVDEINDVDSDCYTIAADSQYQAMLNEEQPQQSEKPEEVPENSALQLKENTEGQQVQPSEKESNAAKKENATPSTKIIHHEDLVKEEPPAENTSNQAGREEQPVHVDTSPRRGEADKDTSAQCHAGHLETSKEIPLSTGDNVQLEPEPRRKVGTDDALSLQGKKASSVVNENHQPAKEPPQGNQASKPEIKRRIKESPKSNKDFATSPSHEKPSKEDSRRPLEPPIIEIEEPDDVPSKGKSQQKKEGSTREYQAQVSGIKGNRGPLADTSNPPWDEKPLQGADLQPQSLSAERLKVIPGGRAQSKQKEEKKEEEPKRLDAQTVEQIPKHTSRVVQTYRMNEWAKHLTNADIPELEPIQPFAEKQPKSQSPAEKEEAAPVKMTDLLQTPLNGQPPPAVESRVPNEGHPHDSWTGSQKKQRRSTSPRRLSGLSVGSAHNLSQHLPHAVQPPSYIPTSSSVTLLSSVAPVEPAREESEKAKPKWKGPLPLIAVREDMVRGRLSSLSLPTDPYTRNSPGSPTELSPQYSTFSIPEEDDDNMPLSRRRTMLHQQATPISPTNTSPAPPRWNNSGVPSRVNSPAVLAAWRESVREDLEERRDPLKITTHSTATTTGPAERSASPFSQLGQRNASSASIHLSEKIAEGMQRGDMSELHREAMRRMQAKANQNVHPPA